MNMDFVEQIQRFVPSCEQELVDREEMLEAIELWGSRILFRENRLAHMTSSGFLLNRKRDRTLMIHHNIYHSWGWTGGHADGEDDLLAVAMKEAREETGIQTVVPIWEEAAALDIIPVWPHQKKGKFVSGHLHLNLTYLLYAQEDEALSVCEDENSGVMWISLDQVFQMVSEPEMIPIYQKLMDRAQTG